MVDKGVGSLGSINSVSKTGNAYEWFSSEFAYKRNKTSVHVIGKDRLVCAKIRMMTGVVTKVFTDTSVRGSTRVVIMLCKIRIVIRFEL